MEALDRRHLLSLFRHLQAVGDEEDVFPAQDGREELKSEANPEGGQLVKIERAGMEEPEQGPVLLGQKETGANEAGDAEQFGANGEPDENEGHPDEGSGSSACLPEGLNTLIPVDPKLHDSLLLSFGGR